MSTPDINHLLDRMNRGDDTALDELMGVVYSELKRTAKGIGDKRSRPGGGDNTLGPTALVNEFYIRMKGPLGSLDRRYFESRAGFFKFAAKVIKNKRIDQARSTGARKRRERMSANAEERDELDDEILTREMIARLGPILDAMEALRPELVPVFNMRFGLEMAFKEIAAELGITPKQASGDWQDALAFIRDRLDGHGDSDEKRS